MQIVECEQLSPEWYEARRGIPSASNFDRIMTSKTMKLSAQADDYIHELIAEVIEQTPPYFTHLGRPISQAMQHGIDTEPEARKWYIMHKDTDVTRVGFCITDCGRWGCSPDFLVGEDGAGEIKCVQLKTQIKYLLDGNLPPEFMQQVHGQLIVTGRSYVDFLSYNPAVDPLLIRVVPDAYTEALRAALEQFHVRYTATLAKLGLQHPRKVVGT